MNGVQVTQLRWQGRHGHFADRALVVVGGKLHQLPPMGAQGGQALEHARHIAQAGFLQPLRGTVMDRPDHAQQIPRTQGHPHQGARRERGVFGLWHMPVRQQAADVAVRWRLNGNVNPLVHLIN